MSKDNEALGRIPMLRKQIGELAKRLEQSHNENCSLRRQISFVSHTSSGVRNISTRASTITSMNTVTNSARRPKLDYVPSYMRALHLIP
jgi:hypothetical protein